MTPNLILSPIIVCISLVFSMIGGCTAQNLETQLTQALSNSFAPSINYEIIEYERVKVLYPPSLNDNLDAVLQRFISEDADISNLCEEGTYFIKYIVKSMSAKFLSIEKTRASTFCKYFDDIEYSTINLILGTDGTVYEIKASENQIHTVVNDYEFQEFDCNNSGNQISGHLLFIEGRKHLLIVKNKVCIEYLAINDRVGNLFFIPKQ